MDDGPAWIVALETLGVARPRGLTRGRQRRLLPRRPRPVDSPGDPSPVSVARATVIDVRPLAGDDEAGAWLERLVAVDAATAALAVLNRVVAAYRIAAADPFAHQLPRGAAVTVRAGFGDGQEVYEGGWRRAVEFPRPAGGRRPARAALHPDERLAALLAARDRSLACEELALRARLDLDFHRPLAAALGTRLALEAALVELGANARASGLEDRLAELRDLRDDVIAAANAALVGPPAEAHGERVAHALGRIEATLRARSAGRARR
jgi:hypothetical protein